MPTVIGQIAISELIGRLSGVSSGEAPLVTAPSVQKNADIENTKAKKAIGDLRFSGWFEAGFFKFASPFCYPTLSVRPAYLPE